MSKKNKPNNQVTNCTLYVEGMHCASCEILIERKLLKQDGIDSVDASLKGGRVDIKYVGTEKPNLEGLNKDFKSLGYKFSDKQFKRDITPAISFKNGGLSINPKKFKNYLRLIIISVSLLVAFYFFQELKLGQYVSVDSKSALPAFLFLGLAAGFSSCAALVGGLLLSMSKQWNEIYIDKDSNREKAEPHMLFHLGRITSFTILGGVLGLLGEKISLDNLAVFATITIIVSIIMFILAMQMLGVDKFQRFKFTAPKSLTRFASDETNFKGRYMPFLLGSLTFLLPCGFTLIAQAIALTSGDFIRGAAIMLMFALGTFVPLMMISFSGVAFNSKPHLTAKFNIVAGLVIIFFAIYNINGQLNVLGLDSLNDIFSSSEQGEVVTANEEGVQIINITAKGFEYIPTSSTTIKAGVPTKIIVDNQGIQGCAYFMAANGLIDNYVSLNKGITEIDLGEPNKGQYKLTCSMGMVKPVDIFVI
ncbi:MAG: sulfite exporter TauE/SafE family protein [Candidatus Dojkabacteria bacterium]|nr:sulfite exporter TauE/SafE family protein [Candidatus Dojkabacteria bacterium]MDQ7021206.1 sulfite exporter TauE/SafE family protein [Candidatus Dojkabacteria bacterium]